MLNHVAGGKGVWKNLKSMLLDNGVWVGILEIQYPVQLLYKAQLISDPVCILQWVA